VNIHRLYPVLGKKLQLRSKWFCRKGSRAWHGRAIPVL